MGRWILRSSGLASASVQKRNDPFLPAQGELVASCIFAMHHIIPEGGARGSPPDAAVILASNVHARLLEPESATATIPLSLSTSLCRVGMYNTPPREALEGQRNLRRSLPGEPQRSLVRFFNGRTFHCGVGRITHPHMSFPAAHGPRN